VTGDAVPSRRDVVIGLSSLVCLSLGHSRPVGAAIDARTVDPMALKLVDWLNLGVTDRGHFISGFSVGWYRDIDPESEDLVRGKHDKLLDAIDLQLTKLANQPLTAHVPLAAALSRAALIGWLPPFEMLGKEWKKLQMRHRILTLRALVTGAHSAAIWHALGEPNDSDTLARALANPRRVVRSPLPLNPNLMLTRLLDFYADEDSLTTPLAHAVLAVDQRTIGSAGKADPTEQASPDG